MTRAWIPVGVSAVGILVFSLAYLYVSELGMYPMILHDRYFWSMFSVVGAGMFHVLLYLKTGYSTFHWIGVGLQLLEQWQQALLAGLYAGTMAFVMDGKRRTVQLSRTHGLSNEYQLVEYKRP